jgi:cell division protein FtsQ
MGFFKRYKIKKIALATLWLLLGCGSTFLLVAAVRKNDQKKCKGININITGVSNHYFIDQGDVKKIISTYAGDKLMGQPIENFDLGKMEKALKKEIWIRDAEMFFDNNDVLQAAIEEREPVARVFTSGGATFYIDSSLMMLPLSEKFSARLPVFTGFPSEAKVLKRTDSMLLKDIRDISTAIQQDPFLMAMIDQVDITGERNFEMLPKMGNELIVFGDGSDAAEKFRKLKLFYKNVLLKTGWSRYSVISLQYKGQVVGKIRGAEDVTADSLRTVQLMAVIAANAEKMAADSVKTFAQDSEKNTADSTMVLQSLQRDETMETPGLPETQIKEAAPVVIKEISKAPPAAKKPVVVAKKPTAGIKKPATEIKKPKAVMEKPAVKNDY